MSSFLSDMTTSEIERDDTRTNDDDDDDDEECRRELSNGLATDGDMSSDENLNDELDFYDFLEAVSDKMDTITHQSMFACASERSFVMPFLSVEERREDSRQRLRRTIAELEEQKRVLKTQLQQRIHIWSENLKHPTFIRTRDKISFSIGVANACFSPLIGTSSNVADAFDELVSIIAGRWPHMLPLVYTIQALFLITLRFFIYKRKSWHYFGRPTLHFCSVISSSSCLVYDFCYFVNLLTLLYLWVFPSSKILFTVCYTLSHGPLGLAIVLWRNSLVFHSRLQSGAPPS